MIGIDQQYVDIIPPDLPIYQIPTTAPTTLSLFRIWIIIPSALVADSMIQYQNWHRLSKIFTWVNDSNHIVSQYHISDHVRFSSVIINHQPPILFPIRISMILIDYHSISSIITNNQWLSMNPIINNYQIATLNIRIHTIESNDQTVPVILLQES